MSSADNDAITRLVHAYTERVGAGDLEGIADLFVHGAVSGDAHPEPVRGRAAVLELYRTTLASSGTGPSQLRVGTTDLAITVTGNDATCASRFVVRAPAGATAGTSAEVPLMTGRYADRFARIDGTWHFTHRHVHLDTTDEAAVRDAGVNLG